MESEMSRETMKARDLTKLQRAALRRAIGFMSRPGKSVRFELRACGNSVAVVLRNRFDRVSPLNALKLTEAMLHIFLGPRGGLEVATYDTGPATDRRASAKHAAWCLGGKAFNYN
jgi:hypothetical protein